MHLKEVMDLDYMKDVGLRYKGWLKVFHVLNAM